MWWTLLLLAHAERPLPDLDHEVAKAAWTEINAMLDSGCAFESALSAVVCRKGIPQQVIGRVDGFQRTIRPDAGLEYLAGLAFRYDGRTTQARRRYENALKLDPDYFAAWYDLGEIHMSQGSLDEAQQAFERVATLVTGDNAWLGPWRLAEVSALRGDAEGFEAHIKVALQHGFSFQHIQGLPNWKAFYADPRLRDTIEKLLTVYATPDVRQSLQ